MKIASICLRLYFSEWPPVITPLDEKERMAESLNKYNDIMEFGVGWLHTPTAV